MGQERAAELYAQILERLFAKTLLPLDKSQFSVFLLCDPFAELALYQKTFGQCGFGLAAQKGADLGERLLHAFGLLLEHHQSAAIIGSDCIEIEPELFSQTAEHLKSSDLVLGPALDGGYYLIAANHHYPTLFRNVAWSTDQVLAATEKAAAALALRVQKLKPLSDIDHAKDLKNYPFFN